MSYSQNFEDSFVLDYFKGQTGCVLEIGANDGITLSNSKLLIEKQWRGILLEPGNVFKQLQSVHKYNDKVECFNFGIGNSDTFSIFFESGAHILGGNDTGLVSTINYNETEKWRKNGVEFKKTEIELKTFNSFLHSINIPIFDFISIDAEGNDWDILQQINLKQVGCKCLCVEHNGDPFLIESYNGYCGRFGMKEALRNNENLIFIL